MLVSIQGPSSSSPEVVHPKKKKAGKNAWRPVWINRLLLDLSMKRKSIGCGIRNRLPGRIADAADGLCALCGNPVAS